MKILLAFVFFPIALSAFCQKVQPIQIQTIDTAKYVIEYTPLAAARQNVNSQIAQVDKQLQQTTLLLNNLETQMADLLKKQNELIKQKTELEYAQKQINQAAAVSQPPPTDNASPQPTESEKKTAKPKKKPKN